MSPEAQIGQRLKRAGQDYLRTRKEFAAASAQYDSMNVENIRRQRAMDQYNPREFKGEQPPRKARKYVPPKESA